MLDKLNFGNITKLVSPPHKRSEKQLAWFRSLTAPLKSVHDNIVNVYSKEVIKRTRFNSQTMSFEKMLNEKFGITSSPFIFIDNLDNNIPFTYTFNLVEERPLYLHNSSELNPTYLHNSAEYFPETDFIVYIPISKSAEIERIRSTVNKYKLVNVKL